MARPKFLPMADVLREEMKDPEFRRGYFLRRFILDVAVTVRDAREAAGLTQTELAERAGMARTALARMEGAKDKRAPRVETLMRLSEALGKRIDIHLPPRENTPIVTSPRHAA